MDSFGRLSCSLPHTLCVISYAFADHVGLNEPRAKFLPAQRGGSLWRKEIPEEVPSIMMLLFLVAFCLVPPLLPLCELSHCFCAFFSRITAPEETTFHLLHLSLMREYIDYEFSELKVRDAPVRHPCKPTQGNVTRHITDLFCVTVLAFSVLRITLVLITTWSE